MSNILSWDLGGVGESRDADDLMKAGFMITVF